MLKKVLSHDTCAGCRICCSFVEEDAWESPVFSEEDMKRIKELGIKTSRFKAQEREGKTVYAADYSFEREGQILLCPCLDEKKGCMLREDKPFECSIWPIRIFHDENGDYLGLAEVCPAFWGEKKEKLQRELKENGLAEKILSMKERQTIRKEEEAGYQRI